MNDVPMPFISCAQIWTKALIIVTFIKGGLVGPANANSTAVFWKQAFVSVAYEASYASTGLTTRNLAAFYSSGSRTDVKSGSATYNLAVLPTSLGLCSTGNVVGVPPGTPVALLARTAGCSLQIKTELALELGITTLLVYEHAQPGTTPLRAITSPNAAEVIGISQYDGSLLETLLLNLTRVTVTVTARPSDGSQRQLSLFLMIHSLLVLTATGICSAGMLFRYFLLYIQTRHLTLSQRSRADQARDILETLQERVLDESCLQDGEHMTCVVCIDDLETGDTVRTLPCDHIFHKDCIDRWLISRQTCPLCKFNILTGMVQEEEEMDVQDAAEEIARGSLPPSVLGQAAALPLPPSRLSVFLDPGRPHGTPSSPPTGSRTQSRLHAHSPVPDNSLLEDSTSFTEIVMLDRSNSMMLPTSSQSQRQSSRATGSHTQSALSTCPGPSQPDVVIRPSTAKSWRVAYVSGQRSKYMQGCEFPIHMVYVLTSNRPT